jgi:hypothetical protein
MKKEAHMRSETLVAVGRNGQYDKRFISIIRNYLLQSER